MGLYNACVSDRCSYAEDIYNGANPACSLNNSSTTGTCNSFLPIDVSVDLLKGGKDYPVSVKEREREREFLNMKPAVESTVQSHAHRSAAI